MEQNGFICYVCGKKFTSKKANLRRHLKEKHNIVQKLDYAVKCQEDSCDYTSPKIEDLRTHLQSVHKLDHQVEEVYLKNLQVIMLEKRKSSFTKTEEEMLVDFIEKNECLWNVSCSDFKNVKMKSELWQQISWKMDKPVDNLKKKWKNLRDYKREKERKKMKGNKKLTGFESTEDCEETELNGTEDKTCRLSFLDSCPTEQKQKTNIPVPTFVDVPSTSTSEYEPDDMIYDINSTVEEMLVPKSETETEFTRMNQSQTIYKQDDIHPIRKFFDCFADSVIELPPDLQRQAKSKIMNLITELEEIASDRS